MSNVDEIIKQQGADSPTVQVLRQFFPVIEQAEKALQSQDREDAERFRKIMNMTRAEREEVLFFPDDKDVVKAIDHARRVKGGK